MAEKKTGSAKHSADYHARHKAESEKLGIKEVTIMMPAGSRKPLRQRSSGMTSSRCRSCSRTWPCRGSPKSPRSGRDGSKSLTHQLSTSPRN